MSIEAHRGAIQTKTGPRGGKWWRRGNGAWKNGEPPNEAPVVSSDLRSFCSARKTAFEKDVASGLDPGKALDRHGTTDPQHVALAVRAVFGNRATFADLAVALGPGATISRIAAKVGGLSASFEIPHPDLSGRARYTFYKKNGEIVVKHELIEVAQGAGLGPLILRNSLGSFEHMGVKQIELIAGMEVGRYFWAKMGWQFSDKDQRAGAGAIYNYWLERNGHTPTCVRTPQDIADHVSKGGARIGKQFLLSDDMPNWNGVLRVDRKDKNYQRARRLLGLED